MLMSNIKFQMAKGRRVWSKVSQGFTMIELLIVIAVLGVLATAVLAAINPIEQIDRGRDTGSRSDAEQLLSAIDRYYTTQELFPWQRPSTVDTAAVPLVNGAMQVVDLNWKDPGNVNIVLNKLATGGTAELKQSFVTRISNLAAANKLRIYMRGTAGDSVYVCFPARSGAFDTEARTRCLDAQCTGLPADLLSAGCAVVCPVAPAKAMVCLP